MNDLIKREDVINAIHTYWRKMLETLPTAIVDGEEVYADTRQMDEILKHSMALCNFINVIPSADRPQGEWTPCSEKMPEEDGDYLVSLAFEWGNEIEMGWLLDGEWINPNSHVTVAWQTLPKPWEGADDE